MAGAAGNGAVWTGVTMWRMLVKGLSLIIYRVFLSEAGTTVSCVGLKLKLVRLLTICLLLMKCILRLGKVMLFGGLVIVGGDTLNCVIGARVMLVVGMVSVMRNSNGTDDGRCTG